GAARAAGGGERLARLAVAGCGAGARARARPRSQPGRRRDPAARPATRPAARAGPGAEGARAAAARAGAAAPRAPARGGGERGAGADERDADLLVVGSREHGLLERLLARSVEEAVARRAGRDVLLVH